ncbi:hypothetical protein, partial [Nonomuraea cypriaca]|uniref:hypothetical protein n=1 Tax=Nonomuraea cypriaca TaxID=1187855 RepID=UPI001A9CA59A
RAAPTTVVAGRRTLRCLNDHQNPGGRGTRPDRVIRYGGRLKGNERYWFEQGYKAGGPKACNTWKASDAKVA